MSRSTPVDQEVPAGRHLQQAIRHWGNSLAVRRPAGCWRQRQATLPLTPSVIEECRSSERW